MDSVEINWQTKNTKFHLSREMNFEIDQMQHIDLTESYSILPIWTENKTNNNVACEEYYLAEGVTTETC